MDPTVMQFVNELKATKQRLEQLQTSGKNPGKERLLEALRSCLKCHDEDWDHVDYVCEKLLDTGACDHVELLDVQPLQKLGLKVTPATWNIVIPGHP